MKTLMEEAMDIARANFQNHIKLQTLHQEILARLQEHLASNKCPILVEMLSEKFNIPKHLSGSTVSSVIMNYALEPTITNIKIGDHYAAMLQNSKQRVIGHWEVVSVSFHDVFGHIISLSPYSDHNIGFEIFVYDAKGSHVFNFTNDIPRTFAIHMMASDPRIIQSKNHK